jgi:transcriptional regulator with XRE-family HTH domain
MKHFSRTLAELLEGPPKISQSEFAARCGLFKSKISRLLSNSISLDRETLDTILDNVPDGAMRTKLVAAYLKDVASPGALLHLKSRDGADPYAELWKHLELDCMSPYATAAFKALIQGDHRSELEQIVIHIARIAEVHIALGPEAGRFLAQV